MGPDGALRQARRDYFLIINQIVYFSRNIAFNQCLLTVFTNQAELFKELSKKLVAKYPEFTSDVVLLQAVQLSTDGKIKEAVALLENCQSGNALQMKLTAVQMLLTNVGFLSPDCFF